MCVSATLTPLYSFPSVIQELMQTDLHRVIRTQHLTDDHCQVRDRKIQGRIALTITL